MEKFKINNIKSLYGNEILGKIRRHEKLARSCGRFRSHIHFNLQCKHNKTIPKTLQIKFHTQCPKSQEIIKKAELAMLNIRLSDSISKLSRIKSDMNQIENELKVDLQGEVYNKMITIDKNREENELRKASERQKKKYLNLKYMGNNRSGEITNAETNIHEEVGNKIEPNENVANEEMEGVRRSSRNKNRVDYRALHIGNKPAETPQASEEPPITIEQPTDDKEKWVRNLSKRPLTPSEKKVLSRGQGFAVTPKKLPIDEYIVATELMCTSLSNKSEAAALRGEIRTLLENENKPISNLPKNEIKALEDLRRDKSIVILPADKGKCLVVMDREEYVTEMEKKLADTATYKRLTKDPTQEIRKTLYAKLKQLKANEHISKDEYSRIKPYKTQIPRFKGRPKIHKPKHPLREIVDGKDSVTKGTDKHLSKIFKEYAEDNEYRIKNSEEFVEKMKNTNIEPNEVMVSYDVVALYPSIPQDEAIKVVYDKLVNDEKLNEKTKMTPEEIIELYKICVEGTYFVFNRKLYIQVKGLAIGASTSGFVADIFMEKIERGALTTFINPPRLWLRFVDDTYVFILKIVEEAFEAHLNQQNEHVKFTKEKEENRQLSFMDTYNKRQEDGTIITTIYRKPTHTNQYLDFASNHHISHKLSVPKTLLKRADTLITLEEDIKKEEKTVKHALKQCGYPDWSIERKKIKEKKPTEKGEGEEEENKIRILLPYIKHVSEKIAREFRRHNPDTDIIYMPTTKIKDIVCVNGQDKVPDADKAEVVYLDECKIHNENYIGQTKKPNKERSYEHHIVTSKEATSTTAVSFEDLYPTTTGIRRSQRNTIRHDYTELNTGSNQRLTPGNTAVSEHMEATDHNKGDVTVKILCKEPHRFKRWIKESIWIHRMKPSLNKTNDDSFKLPVIWHDLIA